MDRKDVDKTLNEISMSEEFDDEVKNIRSKQKLEMLMDILYFM